MCVYYGHTFSKLLELVTGMVVIHGEAVDFCGVLCMLLSNIRGYVISDMV